MSTTTLARRLTALGVLGTTAASGLLVLTPSAPVSAAVGDTGSTQSQTVAAPGAGDAATVTVSRVSSLGNQTVAVSWAGFRPSSDTRLANAGDSLDTNTERPVRVYECRGADPASSSDCYGSPGYRGSTAEETVTPFTYRGQTDTYAATPDGPANWQDNVTRADGTGEVDIQVFTKRESAALGCNIDAPCSIVVVPNYGRPANGQGATEGQMDAKWAWARRAVVPLGFLRVESGCPTGTTSVGVEGSPFSAEAMASWRGATCLLASDPIGINYTAIGEPQTRGDVESATTAAGLVIDPLSTAAASSQGVVYAPTAITGLVVAYQIDDADGRPVTNLRLNARMVAKLITASYRSGENAAVRGNPFNVFDDPELKSLNPTVNFPDGSPGNHPLILGDTSDSTLALTRWLAADPDASAFLAGTPDPWGMTVNKNYQGISLPFATFPLLDPLQSNTYEPVQGLDLLSRQLSIARFPGGVTTVENGQNVANKFPRQNPGRREVIGIIDAASADRFRLPVASLRNTAGAYVAPTDEAMLAGVAHSTVGSDGVTRQVDLTSMSPDVYPLTLPVSMAVSTKATEVKRKQLANVLTYVAGDGQVPGDQVGQLPDGYAPLPDAMRQQVLAARTKVLAGYTAPPASAKPSTTPSSATASSTPTTTKPTKTPTTTPTTTPVIGTVTDPVAAPPAALVAPAAATVPAAPGTVPEATADAPMVTVASQAAGGRLLLLPLLGVVVALGLVLAPLLRWSARTGRGPQWLRR